MGLQGRTQGIEALARALLPLGELGGPACKARRCCKNRGFGSAKNHGFLLPNKPYVLDPKNG